MVGRRSDGEQRYNIAVIGDDFGVRKYQLKGRNPNDVVRMASEDQTLINATFVQPNDDSDEAAGLDVDINSQLTFTRRLDDAAFGNHDVLPATGQLRLIWAVGNDNFLLGHREFGAVWIHISPCQAFDASDAVVTQPPGKVLMDVHAILAAVAFGVLMPLGIFSSSFRRLFDGEKLEVCNRKAWYFFHGALMASGALLAVVLTMLAVVAKEQTSGKHFRKVHEVVGLVLVGLIVLQVGVAAFLRPKGPTSAVMGIDGMVDTTDHQEAGVEMGQIEEHLKQEENPAATIATIQLQEEVQKTATTTAMGKTSFARKFWETKHAMAGIVIVLGGAYQIKSGLDIYEDRYYSNTFPATTPKIHVLGILFWIWLGITVGFLVVVAYRYYIKKGGTVKKMS